MYIGVMVVRRTNLPEGLMSLVAFARVTKKVKKVNKAGWKSYHKTISTEPSDPAPAHMYDRIKRNLIGKLRDMLTEQGLEKQQITDAENVVWEL